MPQLFGGTGEATQTPSSSQLFAAPVVVAKTTPKKVQPIVLPKLPETKVESAKKIFSNLQTSVTNVLSKTKKVANYNSKTEGLGAPIGRLLQKVPDTTIKVPKKYKSEGLYDEIVEFVSGLPGGIAQSYGRSLEMLSTPDGKKQLKAAAKNLPKTISEIKAHIDNKEWGEAFKTAFANPALAVALDVADFIPIVGIVGYGLKKGGKALLKQVVREGIEEAEEKAIKTAVEEKIVKSVVTDTKPSVKSVVETLKPKTETKIDVPAVKPEVKVKPKEVSVPREQLPVSSKEGIEKASRLEARVTQSLDKTPQEIKDQLGSTFTQMNKKEQIAKASRYVNDSPEEAMKVLRGEIEAPKDILKNSIYVAMENQAKGDVSLARKLASLASTREGQELSILTEIDKNSPVKAMSEVVKIREEAFRKRHTGKTVKEVSDKVVADIKKKVKVPDKYDWSHFLDSIQC